MQLVGPKPKPSVAPKKAARPGPLLKAPETEVKILGEQEIPLEQLWVDGQNDRLDDLLDPAMIDQLATTIARFGLQHPVQVTRLGAPDTKWRIVLGHRRVAAVRRLGWDKIPAHVAEYGTETQISEARAIENVQRQELHFMEEALSVARMLDVQAGVILAAPEARYDSLAKAEKTAAVAALAERLGKGEQWVRDRAFLARLDGKSRDLVLSGKLPLTHAREISKLADPRARDELAQRAAAGGRTYQYGRVREEPMPMHELREEVSKSLFSLAQVPWALEVPFAGAPACASCPANSANNPGLFDYSTLFSKDRDESRRAHGGSGTREPASGVCGNPTCFGRKNQAAGQALARATTAVAREVREAPKPQRAKAKREAIAKLVPEFVEKDAVAHKVDERLKPRKAQASAAAPARDTHAERRRRAMYDAERKFDEAMRKRVRKEIEPRLSKLVAHNRGLLALILLFKETVVYRSTESGDLRRALKISGGAQFAAAAANLKTIGWESVVALEKEIGRKQTFFDDWTDGPSGAADAVARALGIELDPAPTLESFLPAEFREKPAAAGKGEGPAAGAEEDET